MTREEAKHLYMLEKKRDDASHEIKCYEEERSRRNALRNERIVNAYTDRLEDGI